MKLKVIYIWYLDRKQMIQIRHFSSDRSKKYAVSFHLRSKIGIFKYNHEKISCSFMLVNCYPSRANIDIRCFHYNILSIACRHFRRPLPFLHIQFYNSWYVQNISWSLMGTTRVVYLSLCMFCLRLFRCLQRLRKI